MKYWFAFSYFRKLYLFSSLIEFISSEELDCKMHEKPVFWKAECIESFFETNLKYFGHPAFTATTRSVLVPVEITLCIFSCFRISSNCLRTGSELMKVLWRWVLALQKDNSSSHGGSIGPPRGGPSQLRQHWAGCECFPETWRNATENFHLIGGIQQKDQNIVKLAFAIHFLSAFLERAFY